MAILSAETKADEVEMTGAQRAGDEPTGESEQEQKHGQRRGEGQWLQTRRDGQE